MSLNRQEKLNQIYEARTKSNHTLIDQIQLKFLSYETFYKQNQLTYSSNRKIEKKTATDRWSSTNRI